ncbi:uncharacterized protein LOC126100099 isoform X2 [Schistocerca cancellata]|uniref:uncharacterized protein LOC126100099 isoform X2 n=1 Tax=Schistocerca cancellata TaxID=274614 RepID=UPI0021174914|nr:uncharacterized protein LOC126100099 isoform X2 [Schistocerca cancellata]
MAATTLLLWQVVMLAVAGAHAQFDLPYPLQLVRAAPSAVSPQLYGPQPEAVSLIRGSTQPGDSQQQAPAEEEMTQFHSQDAAGRSLFGYMMADQARIEARAPDGSVRGSYTYLDPSGRAIKVQYWDEGQGFHAAGNHLPATYPGLPQPVRDTPEVEAARKQHLQAYQQVLRRQLQLLYQQQQLQEQQQQQQQVYQPPSAGGGDSEVVVVESDPAAPPTDYAEDEPGQRYPSLPLVPALYDPSHVHDVGRDAVIVDSAAARQPQQGGFYSKGSTAYSDQSTHYGGHPSGVTNVGGYPPVAMQYLQDIARRADTPAYRQAGSKEAVILNNLIGRSATSKARSLEAPAGEAGKVAVPEGGSGASKEELVAETVAAGSSRDEHAAAAETEAGEANRATPGNQRSVVSLKDGPAESYSAMYIYPGRQAKAASPKAAAMPQPQVDGGFFYSFHHPVIPVAVQVAQPVAADAADADAAADAKAPPRGLSVSQRASLYDAVPVAAVHDAQVPPYLRGAVTDHQTKPVFIHYDPADAAAAAS